MTTEVLSRRGSMTLRLTASGPVAPALAEERYENLDLWPTWSPRLRRVEAGVRASGPT